MTKEKMIKTMIEQEAKAYVNMKNEEISIIKSIKSSYWEDVNARDNDYFAILRNIWATINEHNCMVEVDIFKNDKYMEIWREIAGETESCYNRIWTKYRLPIDEIA